MLVQDMVARGGTASRTRHLRKSPMLVIGLTANERVAVLQPPVQCRGYGMGPRVKPEDDEGVEG